VVVEPPSWRAGTRAAQTDEPVRRCWVAPLPYSAEIR
jgi:hypothetical protein